MSVYIKGFKMPESCARCPLEHMDNDPMVFWCSAIKTEFNGNRTEWAREHKTRRKDCPLVPVPPHGRLIADADAVETAWMILRGLGYLKEENQQLEQTVREVFATAPAIEVE